MSSWLTVDHIGRDDEDEIALEQGDAMPGAGSGLHPVSVSPGLTITNPLISQSAVAAHISWLTPTHVSSLGCPRLMPNDRVWDDVRQPRDPGILGSSFGDKSCTGRGG